SRIDVMALDRPSVTPLVQSRPFAWVPSGRFITYAIDSRGLRAIGEEAYCRPGEELQLGAPTDPGGSRQHIMAHLDIPQGVVPRLLEVTLEADGHTPLVPAALAAFGPNRI